MKSVGALTMSTAGLVLIVITLSLQNVVAFLPSPNVGPRQQMRTAQNQQETKLFMANDKDLLRWEKQSRSADANARVVELVRPLGLVLNDDDNGNVFVETVAPKGNAARTGMVKEGDLVVMCSATFGDQMWSCRGVGLARVLAAIRVRSGATVKLVFESPQEAKNRATVTARAAKAAEEARIRAQAKKDQLLKQLEKDEEKLKRGKFFGLF